MRLVIQRVKEASVTIEGKRVSEIGQGLFILVGVEKGDTEEDAKWLASKAAGLRIFDDNEGVMNRSVVDAGGELLAVSQFTLTASTKKLILAFGFFSSRLYSKITEYSGEMTSGVT